MAEEKYYKPILKPGSHLVQSRENPERVRGLSRDAQNKNPDIVEWEEVPAPQKVKSQQPERTGGKTAANKPSAHSANNSSHSEKRSSSSTTRYEPTVREQVSTAVRQEVQDTVVNEIVPMIAEALVSALMSGTKYIARNVVAPWWRGKAKPWIKTEAKKVPQRIKEKREQKKARKEAGTVLEEIASSQSVAPLQLEDAFEQIRFEMDTEEARQHVVSAVYHYLCLSKEVLILSNARIRETFETEQEQIERQRQAERLLTSQVAGLLDSWLSSDTVELDAESTKIIFGMMDGGVRLINGEYIPINQEKLLDAIQSAPLMEQNEDPTQTNELQEHRDEQNSH